MLVQGRHVIQVVPEHVLAEVVPRDPELIRSMLVCRHAEHLVKLFERQRLRLGHEEERGEETEDVPRCEPCEDALWRPCCEKGRDGERYDAVAEGA